MQDTSMTQLPFEKLLALSYTSNKSNTKVNFKNTDFVKTHSSELSRETSLPYVSLLRAISVIVVYAHYPTHPLFKLKRHF